MPHSSAGSQLLDPDALSRRLLQEAHNRDGLPEIAVGLSFLAIAGLSYAQVALPRESAGFKAAVLALAFLIPIATLGSRWALGWLRRRYLIGRFGYVQPKPIGRKQIGVGIILTIVVTAGLFGAVARLSDPDRWILAGTGLFGGALAAFCGRLPRFVAGGALMAATGICVALSGVSLQIGFAILFGLQGLVALVSGCAVFLRFMRQPHAAGD